MKNIIGCLLTLSIFVFHNNVNAQFSLSGNSTDIEDGTIIYMDNTLTDEQIDSAVVTNNTFIFNTIIEDTPARIVLYTIDMRNFRFIWVEDKAMTLKQGDARFKDAIVTGSDTEDLNQKFRKETALLDSEDLKLKEIEFIEQNPSSVLSANMLSVYKNVWGKEKVTELYNLLAEERKTSTYGKRINKFINLNKAPKVGEKYIDLEITDSNGNNIKLSDIKGKAVLLEFWASWCRGCRLGNPELVKTYKEYNSKGFEIYAISQDKEKESWLSAIEKDNLDWTHVSDFQGKESDASLIYGVSGIPDNFLINEDGVIIARNIKGEKLKEQLSELLD